MDGMFYNCYNLRNINLNCFNIEKVTNFYKMIDGCRYLSKPLYLK